MLASTWFDMVIGLDIHFEMVPMPAPVPTPIPQPFVGMTFDPVGQAANLMMLNALGPPGPTKGPVLINSMPANTTGANAVNKLGVPHIVIPPGTMWAPMPKAPKPNVRPGPPPPPDLPIPPPGDAVMIMGSQSVHVLGSNQCRMGDTALSCSDPVRLPTAKILTIPKGAPVMVGGPPAVDFMAAGMSLLRAQWITNRLKKLVARLKPGRLRGLAQRVKCFFTGHPVDVASGRVMTWTTDFELPGPIPLKFERIYGSSWADRDSPLGFGWSHSLDQAVWLELGKVVYRDGEGREIEFDTFDRPDHVLHRGEEMFEPVSGFLLRCVAPFHWEIEGADGVIHEFRQIPGQRERYTSRLVRIRTRDGHAITLDYDRQVRLECVTDSAGRKILFEYNPAGRLARILLPHPTQDGWLQHRKFVYSREGDLIEAHDPVGNKWTFEYDGHLLVRETDRAGLSFYFGYDGRGADASCIRTWGDGGILDHEILYDKANRVTAVTNSLGATTVYTMNEALAVVKVMDPHGNATVYEYDDALRKTAEIDPLGNATRWEYDARGNCTKVTQPDGATSLVEFDAQRNPTRLLDPLGGIWQWSHDTLGRLAARKNPLGQIESFGYEGGFLASSIRADGALTRFLYDREGNLLGARTPDNAETRFEYDRLGRVVAETDAAGNRRRFWYDASGQIVRAEEPDSNVVELRYDAEGNLLESVSAGRRVRFGYSGFHSLAWQEDGGATVRFRYDTEDQLVEIENEKGEKYRLQRDACGNVQEEYGFDGRKRWYERDACGRVKKIHKASRRQTEVEYDACGRTVAVKYLSPMGAVESEEKFAYRPDGALTLAKNGATDVVFQRDELGRVTAELQGDDAVFSRYDAIGDRISVRSLRGSELRIERGEMGDVLAVDAGGLRATFTRDVLGLERERQLPGTIVARWERDRLGRPTARRVLYGGQAFEAQDYVWRPNDTIARIVDARQGTTEYRHDARARLLWAQYPDGRTDNLMPDAVGNVYRSASQRDRVYGSGGELREADGAKYVHDEDGQLVEKLEPDGSRWKYAWDGAGMLTDVGRPDGAKVSFAYDALGRRIRKTCRERTTKWLWDGHVPLHEETTGADPVTWVFEPESFTPLAKLEGNRRYAILTDHLGTPTALHDEAGRIAWQMQLDLYGVPRQTDVAATSCPWRFPGQYADDETGLYYNRFRYYDPNAGRFISSDPVGIEGGLSFYSYVHDPLSWVDPLGLTGSPGCSKGPKAIVLGEGMGRVKRATKALQAGGTKAKWYQAWSKNFPKNRLMTDAERDAALARNRRWLVSKVKGGYTIYDIGPQVGRPTPSPFYAMEKSTLADLGVSPVPLPGY